MTLSQNLSPAHSLSFNKQFKIAKLFHCVVLIIEYLMDRVTEKWPSVKSEIGYRLIVKVYVCLCGTS